MQRFEIALSLGNNLRLVPSMLPFQRPMMNFVGPEPITHESANREEAIVSLSDIHALPGAATPQVG